MQNTRIALLSLAALCLTGCSIGGAQEAQAQAVKDNEARWNQDSVARDVDKLVAHYAANAVLMAPGMPPSSGINEIRKTITEMMADQALSLKFQAARVEVAKSGDFAYTQGSYQMTMTDPASKRIVHDHGSYVTTYQKEPDGSWKAVADIATSEAPPSVQH
jgi:uncharacterized protein (TIGR02246 family)